MRPVGLELPALLRAGRKQILRCIRLLVVCILTGVGTVSALALTPLPRPEPAPEIDPGQSSPFVGEWSVSMPTMEVGEPDTDYAICALPVRIEAADPTHIFYLGPREKVADAAIQLVPDLGGARWEPIAGGPVFFAIWVSEDLFYLYDQIPEVDAGWGMPFVYRRCD